MKPAQIRRGANAKLVVRCVSVLMLVCAAGGLLSFTAESQGQAVAPAVAVELAPLPLSAPQLDKGLPLMQALKQRRSGREFSEEKLSPQQLSELLWATDGLNRDEGGRTAPSALGTYPVDVYVVVEEGIYLYSPAQHRLDPVVAGDFRDQAGTQDFVHGAPVNLVFVADLDKFSGERSIPTENRLAWANIEAGAQSQNAYLYCASEGLVTVVRVSVDKAAFAKTAGLRPQQVVLAAQTVGHPKAP